jgi:hypothetical protein
LDVINKDALLSRILRLKKEQKQFRPLIIHYDLPRKHYDNGGLLLIDAEKRFY